MKKKLQYMIFTVLLILASKLGSYAQQTRTIFSNEAIKVDLRELPGDILDNHYGLIDVKNVSGDVIESLSFKVTCDCQKGEKSELGKVDISNLPRLGVSEGNLMNQRVDCKSPIQQCSIQDLIIIFQSQVGQREPATSKRIYRDKNISVHQDIYEGTSSSVSLNISNNSGNNIEQINMDAECDCVNVETGETWVERNTFSTRSTNIPIGGTLEGALHLGCYDGELVGCKVTSVYGVKFKEVKDDFWSGGSGNVSNVDASASSDDFWDGAAVPTNNSSPKSSQVDFWDGGVDKKAEREEKHKKFDDLMGSWMIFKVDERGCVSKDYWTEVIIKRKGSILEVELYRASNSFSTLNMDGSVSISSPSQKDPCKDTKNKKYFSLKDLRASYSENHLYFSDGAEELSINHIGQYKTFDQAKNQTLRELVILANTLE